jgi:trehalose 6-phosphate synthase
MNIISYRGPNRAGGVAGALSTIFENVASNNEAWWHVSGTKVLRRERAGKIVACACKIPEHIIEGHYRFCNNFLWPIFHDLPTYAIFDEADRTAYQAFNLALGWNMSRFAQGFERQLYFIQDYQLALVPFFIQRMVHVKVSVFWHVPWPKAILDLHIPFMAEIANGLLSANQIGFHTEEYARNFLQFVRKCMPEYTVDMSRKYVRRVNEVAVPFSLRELFRTKVFVEPLGIDSSYWQYQCDKVSQANLFQDQDFSLDQTFVLSVDRADYTKGVIERFDAIDQFFRTNPDWIGRVSFLQVCQRTRSGLPNFDKYWYDCLNKASEINLRYATQKWKPIVWIKEQIEPTGLAILYRHARALLVSSLRDGLNLTAKEFIACSDSGVLLLSQYAGAWHELEDGSLTIDPYCKDEMVARLLEALSMPDDQRRERLFRLKSNVKSHSLVNWFQRFSNTDDDRDDSIRECLLDMRERSFR